MTYFVGLSQWWTLSRRLTRPKNYINISTVFKPLRPFCRQSPSLVCGVLSTSSIFVDITLCALSTKTVYIIRIAWIDRFVLWTTFVITSVLNAEYLKYVTTFIPVYINNGCNKSRHILLAPIKGKKIKMWNDIIVFTKLHYVMIRVWHSVNRTIHSIFHARINHWMITG